jgi:LysM repeat protein
VKPGRDLVIPVRRGGASDARLCSVGDEREEGGARRHGRSRRLRRGSSGWVASDDCQDPFAKVGTGEGLVLEPEPPIDHVSKAKRLATAVPPASAEPIPADASRYVVADGDTLWSIALAHGLSLEQICAWNHIAHPAHAKIFPGEKLWVRGEARAPPAVASAPAPVSAPAPLGPAASSYKLRDGDNLWMVAKKLNVKVADLMRWNRLDEDSVLQPGQVLKVGDATPPSAP